MSSGNTDFKILQRSPLDQIPPPEPEPVETEVEPGPWVASRFNIQSTAEDGQLIVWNTFRGTMSMFPAAQRAKVKSLLTRRPFEARSDGLVGYLHERGFLVKQDTDELRHFQLRFGQQHYRSDSLELTLLASEDCNFRCEYCYEKFARGTMLPWVRSAIKKFVESRLPGLRALRVAWFGGEPLYGFDAIEDLGAYFHEITTERAIDLSCSVTTNGYLLTPSVVDQLLSWQIKNLQVTIDGAPEDHNRLRHTRNGEETFSRIFDNIKALRDRPDEFTMYIRINFDPQSYPRLEGLLDLLGKEFGDDERFRLLLRPVGRWGGPKDRDLNVCGFEESRKITSQLVKESFKRGMGDFDDLRKMGRFGAQACYAARPNHFVVGADGKLMKCTVALDTKEFNVVGRVNPDGELDLDYDRLALWSEPRFVTESKCQQCLILPVCQSMACPYQRIKRAEAYCPPLKRELKKRLGWVPSAAGSDTKKVMIEQHVEAHPS